MKDDIDTLSAGLAYYAMFSIFPLLLLLLALLGFLLKSWSSAIEIQKAIVDIVGRSFTSSFGKTLNDTLTSVRDNAGTATGIGLVTLLIGASGVFSQLDASFNKIWSVEDRPAPPGILHALWALARRKLFSFGMVLAVGFLLMVSLALTGGTQALMQGIASIPYIGDAVVVIIGIVVTLVINTIIFALLFKYLPRTHVGWKDVITGAMMTAVIWEGAKRLLAIYIGTSSYASAYGLVGTFLVLMAWLYFSSLILFLGAEFTEVYARRCGSHCHQDMLPLYDPETREKVAPATPTTKEEITREEKHETVPQ
jgi:membrane protein